MKKSSFLALAIFVLTISYANAQSFEAGTNVISAGIGLGSTLDGYGYNSSTPGFSVQYDRGIWEAGPGVISLGGYLGFKGYNRRQILLLRQPGRLRRVGLRRRRPQYRPGL